jgi:SET domain-containing protein
MEAIVAAAGFVQHTGTEKGRGVFAARALAAGEVVEVCPVVILRNRWDEMPPEVRRVVFDWGYLSGRAPASCLALGWGSMYNHANPANVRYVAVPDEELLKFVAARDIAAGEELTINYNETGGDVHSTADVWFEESGVTPLP